MWHVCRERNRGTLEEHEFSIERFKSQFVGSYSIGYIYKVL